MRPGGTPIETGLRRCDGRANPADRHTLSDMSGFAGIPADAAAFYTELAEHNTREWWAANADRYEASVRHPVTELTDALSAEFGEAKIYRPHRDLRYTTDKTPYKDRQGAIVQLADGMGLYLAVGPGGLTTGGGSFHNSPDQVERYRAAVDDEAAGTRLESIVEQLRGQRFEVGGDLLKTRPRGVAPDHPRVELLRHKSLIAWRDHGMPAWVASARVVGRVRTDWRAIRPLGEWLANYVGPAASAAPAPRVVRG